MFLCTIMESSAGKYWDTIYLRTMYIIQSNSIIFFQTKYYIIGLVTTLYRADSVVQWLAPWTCEPMVLGSNLGLCSKGCFIHFAHFLSWQPMTNDVERAVKSQFSTPIQTLSRNSSIKFLKYKYKVS